MQMVLSHHLQRAGLVYKYLHICDYSCQWDISNALIKSVIESAIPNPSKWSLTSFFVFKLISTYITFLWIMSFSGGILFMWIKCIFLYSFQLKPHASQQSFFFSPLSWHALTLTLSGPGFQNYIYGQGRADLPYQ